ncbi:MAG: FAD-dependent oxidoreductase [Candidatus Krumholzibacteriota bacterium]|nr:FAD-dependent oxidoreductase [Candidatus Krumholzibacteriota bacterium]
MNLRDVISPFYAWKRALEKPFTIRRPVEDRPGSPRYRGFHVNDVDRCIGCGTCEAICQNEAIDMVFVPGADPATGAAAGDSGLRPRVDYGRCCWCALCVDVCPTGCLGMASEYNWITLDGDDWRYVPGVETKPWDGDGRGYRRGGEAWLLDPARTAMPMLEPAARSRTFDEMTLGYDDDLARAEAMRCIECGLCVEACPTHMDVPQYIRAIRENRLDDALELLYDTNPFSESCGRVCTARCEEACALGREGEPIAIRWLKRHITDSTLARRNEVIAPSRTRADTGKRVAVVGGGPSGLTAAFYLRQFGHAVTVFEMNGQLGGMLRYGIPAYRLPDEVLDREIGVILDAGVETELGVRVGGDTGLADLRRRFDAVYVAIGAWEGSRMPIDGLDEAGVLIGIEFLDRIAGGERPDLGRSVAVVGGGNTAMDCCRSAVRLGAGEVRILYRRTEREMPAAREEIEEAREEGVVMDFLVTPVGIARRGGRLAITCLRMELGEPDASGRRRPVPIEKSEFVVEADTCIMAIGQQVVGRMAEEAGVAVTRWNTVETDPDTLQTDVAGIFAGGDGRTGPDDAIAAVADGKRAAWRIHRYLMKGTP